MSPHSEFTLSILKRVLIGGLLEFGPILIFLSAFDHFHIYKATMILMITTIVSTVLTYRIQKRLPYVALYVALITIGFGYLTLMHREPKFIQMRDTLYDTTWALTLLLGLMINVPFLKFAFNDALPMTLRAWHRLTYAWIGFFLMGAALNEIVRRNYSLQSWFNFKGIMVVVTISFGLAMLFFFYEKPRPKETLEG